MAGVAPEASRAGSVSRKHGSRRCSAHLGDEVEVVRGGGLAEVAAVIGLAAGGAGRVLVVSGDSRVDNAGRAEAHSIEDGSQRIALHNLLPQELHSKEQQDEPPCG